VRLETEFAVDAAPDAVYHAILDIPSVAACLPGATVGEASGDGGYQATIAVKVGPVHLSYGGIVRVAVRDDAARRATLHADAEERHGHGAAQADIVFGVSAADGSGTTVDLITDIEVTGRGGQMGQGILHEVAVGLIDEFARCLSSRLAGPEGSRRAAAEHQVEISAIPLVLHALESRMKHLFHRP
jgi:carbon monoxide dehydrogenase subunit G